MRRANSQTTWRWTDKWGPGEHGTGSQGCSAFAGSGDASPHQPRTGQPPRGGHPLPLREVRPFGIPRSASTSAIAVPKKLPRTLDWSLAVEHVAVRSINAQLAAGERTIKSVKDITCPRCVIDVWATGDTATLAICRGSLCPRTSHMHVHWLGKNFEYAAHNPVEGWDRVASPEVPGPRGDEASPARPAGTRSLALAILGVLGAISELFGMVVVELEAEDNGSGKLIAMYRSLGFQVVESPHDKDPMMEAPIVAITKLGPEAWVGGIVPADFDAWGWLQSDLRYSQVERILLGNEVPWRWSWKASWPLGAAVDARLQVGNEFNKISTEVRFRSRQGSELAFARGTVRLRQGTLRLLWFGRTQSRPVHPSVQGQLVYSDSQGGWGGWTSCGEIKEGSANQKNITVAMALLGVQAVLARWFGVVTAELTALDDGTGKLIAYLRSFGFENHAIQPAKRELGDPIVLACSCEGLAKRCCPHEWRAELPRASELSMLAKLCPKD